MKNPEKIKPVNLAAMDDSFDDLPESDQHQKGQKSQTELDNLETGKKIKFSEMFRYATKRLGFQVISICRKLF